MPPSFIYQMCVCACVCACGLHNNKDDGDIIILWIAATGCYFRAGEILTAILSFDISQHLIWGWQ